VLQRILKDRLVFTPSEDRKSYRFEAPTRFDRLFAGIVSKRPTWIPEGTEGTDHIGPEDTFDADYGRLLEKAYGQVVATLVPVSWNRLVGWLQGVEALRQAAA